MEILPVPVALARKYMCDEQVQKYIEGYNTFYNSNTEIEIRSALRIIHECMQDMPEVSDAFPSEPFTDLKIKYNQKRLQLSDMLLNEHRKKGTGGIWAERMKTESRDMLRYYAGVVF